MINQGRNVTCFIQKESTWLTKKLVSWINFLVSANLQNIFFVLFLHLTRTQNIYRIKAFFVSFQTNLIKFDSFMVYRLHFLLIKKVQHWYSYTAQILTQKTLSQTCSVFITHFFIYCLTQYSFYIKWTFRWMFTCMLTKIEGNACSLNSRIKLISSIHNSVTTNVVSSVKAASYSLFCDFIISILESFWSPQRDTESRKLLSVFVQKITKSKKRLSTNIDYEFLLKKLLSTNNG